MLYLATYSMFFCFFPHNGLSLIFQFSPSLTPSPCSPSSWYVTMQICVVSFQSWRNVFGLLLRELRPWRLHWGTPRRVPWWTAGATSRRSTASRTPWGQRTPWGAPMQHRSVLHNHCLTMDIVFSEMSEVHAIFCLVCKSDTVAQIVVPYLTLFYHTDSQASETEAAAHLLSHQPVLHLHPCHWTRQHLQQRPLPEQHDTAKIRQHQLQPKLCPEQHVSLNPSIHLFQPVTARLKSGLSIRTGFWRLWY